MRPPILPDDVSYTFADYFRLRIDIEELLIHFGYAYQVANYCLPRSTRLLERLPDLRNRIEESLPYVSLNNELARREFLIAPVLLEVVHYTQAKIRTEFPISVSAQLKGTVDYYVQQANNLLIVEAKNADLQQGFVQLAVELVAFDQWLTPDAPLLYGAVSMGNIWQFGILDRMAKQITQDFNLFRVPADLDDLMPILVAILAD
ncbi:hypothetical protein [Candidatus Entotheonella palauensis]|uniref:hypothetical protein n=1 Tax=Candidatus Entotheonella palauensis TaxID=93172 RepID=UPI000B7E0FEE|nr:hypothetical protein [Candidatus Entotheonella palauensis]